MQILVKQKLIILSYSDLKSYLTQGPHCFLVENGLPEDVLITDIQDHRTYQRLILTIQSDSFDEINPSIESIPILDLTVTNNETCSTCTTCHPTE